MISREFEVDVQKVEKWLSEQWQGDKMCPVCGNDGWHISENLAVLLPLVHGTLRVDGKRIVPSAVVACGKCGYTMLFNAVVADVLVDPKTTENEPVELEHVATQGDD